jgi:hypothetical protein
MKVAQNFIELDAPFEELVDVDSKDSYYFTSKISFVTTFIPRGRESDARPSQSLQLRIEAPPELAAVRKRLESIDPQRFTDIAQLVGLTDVGPAIRVALVPESSDLARGVSPWIAGFTVEESVILFPARSPTYPNNSLEDVMRHEVAHALIWRTSGGQPIPRWFNEGVAMAAERERGFEDQTQLSIN